MAFVVRYPDRVALLDPLIAFAREELEHFHRVYRLLEARGLTLGPDAADPYVGALLASVRTGRDERLLDRLLVAGVVEARGCERFGMIAQALPTGELADFYADITRSEARHHGLFLRLARSYFDENAIATRLDELLDAEARILEGLPLRAALH
jgi:tRNA 2-(methylsulfanyl)-N6-isopentenyladenosine37 hydroxylase